MGLKNFVVMAFVLTLLSACAAQYDDRMVSGNDKNKLIERQAVLLKSSFDLSKVTVARFSVDSISREVNSLMPLTLSSYKSEQGLSLTLLTFNAKQDQLTLFSFDALSGKGYEVTLLLSDFEAKKTLLFPVVSEEDGAISDVVFELNELFRR